MNRRFAAIIAALTLLAFNATTVAPAYAASQETPAPIKKVSKQLVEAVIKPNLMSEAFAKQEIKTAQAQKLADVKAEQARIARQEAQKAAQIAKVREQAAQAKAQAEAKAREQAAQKTAQVQTSSQAPSATSTKSTTSTTSGVNQGTFTLSFYDPSALGSSLGYGGVAANLSVFPKGTQLKITLSDGTVWYRVVNDTGSFAAGNPRQLDVAMPNSEIPSAGVLSATVEVIG